MSFVGPLTLLRRVVNRLDAIGWVRAAGSLAFTTILGIVPLATVALAFVAQFPMFQDFLQVLERFLLRHMLPQSASALVNDYILGMAAEAAELKGVWILFVMVTAILVVHAIESEINAIWGIRQKRPLLRRILVYAVGITAGPALVGGAISLTMWLVRRSIAAVPLERSAVAAILTPLPFLFAVAGFTILYAVAPARRVSWWHALASGALAAIAFEVTRYAFAWYVANSPTYEILYGALAAVPLFLLWIFIFWMIVLAGAAVTAALADAGGRR
jgi:membrane protein